MISLFDEADEQMKFYLDDDYVNWKDCIPGVREFLQEVETKEAEKQVIISRKNTVENKDKAVTASRSSQARKIPTWN